MGLLTEFIGAAKSIISVGKTLNQDGRKRIRDAVLRLSSDIGRAVALIVNYLEGAKSVSLEHGKVEYLRKARVELLDTCNKFHICGSLYELCDEFNQIFNPVRATVEVGKMRQIQSFLDSLQYRETSIINDIDEVFDELDRYAYELSANQGNAQEIARLNAAIVEYVSQKIELLKQRRDEIDELSEQIVREM